MVSQFSQGSHIAFKALFMRYYPKVRSFIMGLVKSESEAEDLTQEVFLKLWTHREKFCEVEVFGTYLYVLTKNTTSIICVPGRIVRIVREQNGRRVYRHNSL